MMMPDKNGIHMNMINKKEQLVELEKTNVWTSEEEIYAPVDLKDQRLWVLERINNAYKGHYPISYLSLDDEPLKYLLKNNLVEIVQLPKASYVKITNEGKKFYGND